jgi:glycosyltransferase involved in cell wall biosynthesis
VSTSVGHARGREAEAAGRPSRRRRVAIFGIDNFSRKNRAQIAGLNARGYVFDVFTNDILGDSASHLPAGNALTVLAPDMAGRTTQLVRYLRAHAAELNHVEVYPGGRYAGVYAALARAWRVPTLAVERGDLLYQSRYGAATRLSMRACYRLAHRVWYREPYQEQRLREQGARDLFFLGNAVAAPGDLSAGEVRSTDFAWVNRLIVERRADWVVTVLGAPAFAGATAEMVGFLEGRMVDAGMRTRQDHVVAHRPPNLRIAAFGEPSALYQRARFFLLPSEIVFCNNALLEAMAHGVVPLVSDVEGARRIVDDGVNGFVFPHTPEGLRSAMESALRLTPAGWAAMSRAAAEKVRTHFGLEQWCDRLAHEYRRLDPHDPAAAAMPTTSGAAASGHDGQPCLP